MTNLLFIIMDVQGEKILQNIKKQYQENGFSYTATTDSYARFDCYYNFSSCPQNISIAEVKTRNFSEQYLHDILSGELYIEVNKVNSLLEIADKNNYTNVSLFVKLSDNTHYIFDLKSNLGEPVFRIMNKVTDTNKKEKVMKQVYLLNYQSAKITFRQN